MAPKAITKKAKIAAACKALKVMGYSSKIVRPILSELLKVYDGNWKNIEESNYKVLVEAIVDSEEEKLLGKESEALVNWLENEDEENEPLSKRIKRSGQKNQSSSSVPNCSNERRAARPSTNGHGKGKKRCSLSPPGWNGDDECESDESISLLFLEDSEDESGWCPAVSEKRIVTYEGGKSKRFCNGSGSLQGDNLSLEENALDEYMREAVQEDELLPVFEVPLAIIDSDSPKLLIKGSSDEKFSHAKGNCSTFPGFINLDAEDITPRLVLDEDASSKENCSDMEGNLSESTNYKQSESENAENGTQDMLKFDIASSSSGNVKISIMVKSSQGSNLPSVETVLKQVEDQCIISYGIQETGFSMLRLMKEVCDCFLDAITANQVSSPLISENSSPLTVPIASNSSFKCDNLFDVSPQIPKSVRPFLDFSLCKISLNPYVTSCSTKERYTMELNSSAPSSSKMMTVQKNPSFIYFEDIAKGQEGYPISLVNEINKETRPIFNYISKNVAYQNAYVKFLLSRISEENCCSGCFGDCLSLEAPCACAGETGGEFANTPEGLVKEKFLDDCISVNLSEKRKNLFYCKDCPLERSKGKSNGSCKGHVIRKFIKECWYKCGCSMNCGNRVVQRGITAKLQVFMTPEGKGWGIRTLEDLPKGAFVCEYVGEVVTNIELDERNLESTRDKHTYPVLLDAGWSSEGDLKDEEALFLDGTSFGNVARFINHRCDDANMVEIPVEVETPDHHYYHLAFFTTRKVNAMEELTWDYGIDFKDPVKAFQCLCGSKFCRYGRENYLGDDR